MPSPSLSKIDLASYFMISFGLIFVLELHLLSAILSGLLVYHIVYFGAKRLGKLGVSNHLAKLLLLTLVAALVIALLSLGGLTLASSMSSGPESLVGLLTSMADVVIRFSKSMPSAIQEYLPTNIEELQKSASEWLLSNAALLSGFGKNAGVFLAHVLFGMIIGGLVAVSREQRSDKNGAPLTTALRERAALFARAFQRIVFSQLRISGLNTLLTALFLSVVMPILDYHLPLIKTMIAVTFFVGLMPIVGNIISNTVIFLIALGVSPMAALSALIFLVVVHKLEYFVNARIIGNEIRADAWEIMTALLVMDAAFGMPGLIAAPIYYAYVKDELATRKLI